MISLKNKENPYFLSSKDDSNKVGCPKQSHTLNMKEGMVQSSSNRIETSVQTTLKAMPGKVQKESGINNCPLSKVTCQTKPDQGEVIPTKSDSYEIQMGQS